MATVAVSPNEPDLAAVDQCVVLYNVGWDGYLHVLRACGEKGRPVVTYLDGNVYLMSPAHPHEFLKKRLGELVVEVTVGLDIPCTPAGETTFRRRAKQAGAQPDESYYLANEPLIRGKGRENLHLRRDPPPDLVIESVNTHAADNAVEAWRRFRVPEVWVCDGDSLQILALQRNRKYAEVAASVSFPFLTAAEILDWVSRPQTGSETDWIKQLRVWVREVLLPRARGGA
jgi:Uma2 family endonuclease